MFAFVHSTRFHCVKRRGGRDGDSCVGKDDEGQSALHHACLGGHLETVRYVTDNGAPGTCNDRDNNDMTPFHLACEGGFLEVVVRRK